MIARAWGVLPGQLEHLPAGDYLEMVHQLATEYEQRRQSDGG